MNKTVMRFAAKFGLGHNNARKRCMTSFSVLVWYSFSQELTAVSKVAAATPR